MKNAWQGIDRTILDVHKGADIVLNLNSIPLPPLPSTYDVVVAFDVLEHLKYPALVLEWIPTEALWIPVPTATSVNCQRIEIICHRVIKDFGHLYSFNMLTINNLVQECGWTVDESFYTLDTQSIYGRIFNYFASALPYWLSMGIALKCSKKKPES